ncbi:unnamed protein product [Vitrella brassicaformis CCMP3155]|uniref:Uncharacterized protein n=2 Tax=Vitrella brassicaformis TaxID=1169539 RepID=A0A0G4ERI2_VITBC|nr:unnamed protein product [Vitrella brassicaformis CCMP3155]|eukprot:CEL99898.1 unnamed protein product [Vitrella brassicaformis CCMP3155]
MTAELQSLYDDIKAAMPQQRQNYDKWLLTLPDDLKKSLVGDLEAIGLSLDVASGRVSYMPSFEPVKLPYELCYIRHGKTEGNTEPRIYQGQVDYPENQINEIGIQQAEEAADKMEAEYQKGWKPDLIVYSPLGRAKHTGEAFAKRHPDIPTVVVDATKEMAFGEWDNLMVKDLCKTSIGHLFYLEQNAMVKPDVPHSSPSGPIPAENFCQVLIRLRQALTDIGKMPHLQGKQHAKVLMYGHSMAGAAVQMLLGHGMGDEKGLGFDGRYIMPNATPYMLPAKKPDTINKGG